MRIIVHTLPILLACLLRAHLALGQWQPGQTYDINQEEYNSRVLWQTNQAIFSSVIRINEYRGYHHILASYDNNTYIVYIGYDWRPRIVKVGSDGTFDEEYLDDDY